MVNQSTSWGKVAGWYDKLLTEDRDSYQEKVIKPNLLRLLNPKPNSNILDVGCGQGFFSKEIAKTGANVVGIDVAFELINLAKSKTAPNEKYFNMSAEKMSGLKHNQFDSAICVLALQNIKNFQSVLLETSRVLKPNGKVLMVLNHPSFRVPKASSWEFDVKLNIQFRRVEKYLSEITNKVDMNPGMRLEKNKKFTYSFHRPLQAYFKAFKKANFCVTGLEEWVSHKISDKGARKIAEDTARKEIPLFMCLELTKL